MMSPAAASHPLEFGFEPQVISGRFPMPFIEIPTEQTTAITDVILALQAIAIRWSLGRTSAVRPFWTWIWSWIFTLMCVASLLGAVAHGFQMTPETNALIWNPLYLLLGLIVSLFAVAAVSHRWDDELARRFLPAGLGIAIVFYLATQFGGGSFLLFVVYEALMMLIALWLYLSCFWLVDPVRGSGFLAAGVFVGLLAAAINAMPRMELHFLWTFDNHGLFHLVQMASLILLAIGLHRSHPVTDSHGGQSSPAS